MTSPSDPHLAPPGAGLPLPELLIARLLFRFRRLSSSPADFKNRFESERATIRKLVESLTPEQGSSRVLIPRLRGMEDSSRHWSVWMTLDHLRIVHSQIAQVIAALVREITPDGAASTAAVKPSATATHSVVPEYEQSCDLLLAATSDLGQLQTTARFRHPWFGPLNAADWQALAATHLGIHRAQIQTIIASLESASHS